MSLVAVGCSGSDTSSPHPTPALALHEAVVGQASTGLVNGRFALVQAPAGKAPEIDAARAEALALAWRMDFAQWQVDILSQQHGAPVAPESLAICRQTLYAASSVEPVDPAIVADGHSAPWARAYGPWWLVSLCNSAGQLEVVLAVSAYSTDLHIKEGRQIITPPLGGQWFFALGVPSGTDMVVSPEDAAVAAADHSGRRVAQVPRLIAPPPTHGPPQSARWQLELDGPATVRDARAGVQRETRTLYVGAPLFRAGREVSIPDAQQPTEFTGTFDAAVTIGEKDKPPQWRQVRFTRRADAPVAFTAVASPSPLAALTGALK